jgi:hypothetical protein
MAEKKIDLQKVADGLGISLNELLSQGLSKAVSTVKPVIEKEIEEKKGETNKQLFESGKTFVPKLKELMNNNTSAVVCECAASKKQPTVQIVGYINQTKELVVYLNDKLSAIPESYLITSKEELTNAPKVVKKHITTKIEQLENKGALNDVEKKKLETLKERFAKMNK